MVSIDDPFDQNDWEAWQKFTAGAGIHVVKENPTVANPKKMAKVVSEKVLQLAPAQREPDLLCDWVSAGM